MPLMSDDQRRIHANLKHRHGHLRKSDVAGWTPEELAQAEA